MDLTTQSKVSLVDLQKDCVFQKSVTLTPKHKCRVVHAPLQFVVDAARKDSRAQLRWFTMVVSGTIVSWK